MYFSISHIIFVQPLIFIGCLGKQNAKKRGKYLNNYLHRIHILSNYIVGFTEIFIISACTDSFAF